MPYTDEFALSHGSSPFLRLIFLSSKTSPRRRMKEGEGAADGRRGGGPSKNSFHGDENKIHLSLCPLDRTFVRSFVHPSCRALIKFTYFT